MGNKRVQSAGTTASSVGDVIVLHDGNKRPTSRSICEVAGGYYGG